MFGPGHITPGVSEASDEILSLGLEIAGSRWAVASPGPELTLGVCRTTGLAWSVDEYWTLSY